MARRGGLQKARGASPRGALATCRAASSGSRPLWCASRARALTHAANADAPLPPPPFAQAARGGGAGPPRRSTA